MAPLKLDYKRFEDRLRKVLGWRDSGWSDPDDFITDMVERFGDMWKQFNYPQWHDQDYYLELWIEKDALSQLFNDVGKGFNVYTCPSRGYPSYSFVMDAVTRFHDEEKPIILLYFGDFDPSGLNIPVNLIERINRYGDFEEGKVTLKMIALNLEQIRQYQLPPAPAKKTDVRYKKFVETTGTDQVVELDALEPPVLQSMIKESISLYIDPALWNETVRKTEAVRDKLMPLFDKAKDTIDFDEDLLNELNELVAGFDES